MSERGLFYHEVESLESEIWGWGLGAGNHAMLWTDIVMEPLL